MRKPRTRKKWSGQSEKSQVQLPQQTGREQDPWNHALVLLETVCLVAGSDQLLADTPIRKRLRQAIIDHDSQFIYGWLVETFSFQATSDQAAATYMDRHGRLQWGDVEYALSQGTSCPKLWNWWTFRDCGFEKNAQSCNEPSHFADCPIPRMDLRRGQLSVMAVGLFLLIRDEMKGDLVEWIDARLREARAGSARDRQKRMRESLIRPLDAIYSVGRKVLNMALADLLMAAPESKQHWFETGISFVAVDSLVHNAMHRMGLLKRLDAEHNYGPACHGPKGCQGIIERVATRIDASKCNPAYPKTFGRWVQHALWRYGSETGLRICNSNAIDDAKRCRNIGCFLFKLCGRVSLMKRE